MFDGAVRRVTPVLIALLVAPRLAAAQTPDIIDLLRDVGAYVEGYFSRVQSIVGVETITRQSLTRSFGADGPARILTYDLRLDWSAVDSSGANANVVRELRKVNGRVPRPMDKPECTDPRVVSPEPLDFLRPEQQPRYIFGVNGASRLDNRQVYTIDYRVREPRGDKVDWDDECVRVESESRTRGRVWIDVLDKSVLRVDEMLNGQMELRIPVRLQRRTSQLFMVLERADTSIRYKPVRFANPDETLLLPASVDSVSVWANGPSPVQRTTHRYSDYRRFVTGGRVVQE